LLKSFYKITFMFGHVSMAATTTTIRERPPYELEHRRYKTLSCYALAVCLFYDIVSTRDVFNIQVYVAGHAMFQAANRWTLTAEA
jgi:hypothetical protein